MEKKWELGWEMNTKHLFCARHCAKCVTYVIPRPFRHLPGEETAPPLSHLTCPRSQLSAPQTLACVPALWGRVHIQIPIQPILPFPQAEGLPTLLVPGPTESSHRVLGSRSGVVIRAWPNVVGLHSLRSCSFTTKDYCRLSGAFSERGVFPASPFFG